MFCDLSVLLSFLVSLQAAIEVMAKPIINHFEIDVVFFMIDVILVGHL